MPYLSRDEFVKILRGTSHREILRTHVFSGLPYVFRESPQNYESLIRHLSDSMEIPIENLAIVGSGKLGFSLSPEKFGVPFGSHSDLDVLVVSDCLFDRIWIDLLRITRTQFAQLSQSQKFRIKLQRDSIYWGRIFPDSLLRFSQVADDWVEAFRSLGRIPPLARFQTSGRLYRTWDHAEVYHLDGLARLAMQLDSLSTTTERVS